MAGNDKYITIHQWMISDLRLSGVELLVYAMIYGFTLEERTTFYASQSYIADRLNVTVRAVARALSMLESKGMIIRAMATPGSAVQYSINSPMVRGDKSAQGGMKKVHTPYEKSSEVGMKKVHTPYEKSSYPIPIYTKNKVENKDIDLIAANAAMSSAVADAAESAATSEPKSSDSSEPLTPTPSPKEWAPKEFIEFFNSTIAAAKSIIPVIKSVAGMRLSFLQARTREHGKEAVKTAITKAAASDFLNGKGGRGFIANCDWILRPNNMPKILEGNYDNRSPQLAAQTQQGYASYYYNDPRRSTPVRPHTDEDYYCDF